MKFNCPNPTCGQPLEVHDDDGGTMKVQCPLCGQKIQIEAEESPREEVLEPLMRTNVVRTHEMRQHSSMTAQQCTAPKQVNSGHFHRVVDWGVALCVIGLVGGAVWCFLSDHRLCSGSVSIPLRRLFKEPDVKLLDWQLLTEVVVDTEISMMTLHIEDEFSQKGGRFLVVRPKLSADALAGIRLGPGQFKRSSDLKRVPGLTLAGIKKKEGGASLIFYEAKSNGQGVDYLFDVDNFVLRTPDGKRLVSELIGYNLGKKNGLVSRTDLECGMSTPLAGDELAAIWSVTESAAELAAFQFQFKNYPAQRLEIALGPQLK